MLCETLVRTATFLPQVVVSSSPRTDHLRSTTPPCCYLLKLEAVSGQYFHRQTTLGPLLLPVTTCFSGAAIEKQYWVNGREELRRFLGTLRFDINTLAATSPPSTAKKLLATKKDMFDNIDKMDFAMRSKNQAAAAKAYDTVVKQMATFL